MAPSSARPTVRTAASTPSVGIFSPIGATRTVLAGATRTGSGLTPDCTPAPPSCAVTVDTVASRPSRSRPTVSLKAIVDTVHRVQLKHHQATALNTNADHVPAIPVRQQEGRLDLGLDQRRRRVATRIVQANRAGVENS